MSKMLLLGLPPTPTVLSCWSYHSLQSRLFAGTAPLAKRPRLALSGSILCKGTGAPANATSSSWASKLLSATVKKRKSKTTTAPNVEVSDEPSSLVADYQPSEKEESTLPYTVTNRNYKRKQNILQPVIETVEPKARRWEADDDIDDYDLGDDEPDFEGTHNKLPAEVRFFDTAIIYLKSGDGGNGCLAFRREKFIEKGGPSGGDGGRGGNVWAIVDPGMNSLLGFRKQIHWRAQCGGNGSGSSRKGDEAPDLFIPVPRGTIVRHKDAAEDEKPLAELLNPGDKALLVAGGRGGRGNESFKTSKDKAPVMAERGEAGTELWVEFELRMVADAGIIGVPNAGKSTLLAAITAARPKIANYPFTTLVPNLGVNEFDFRTTVFADVPGLMEGAHEGLGLGHEFLRHVQRCRVLVHIIDGTSPDPLGDFHAINLELELFNPALKDKPQVVAYNKMDVTEAGELWPDVRDSLLASGVAPESLFCMSAVAGEGVDGVLRRVHALLDQMGPLEVKPETDATNITTLPSTFSPFRMDEFEVEVDRGGVVPIFTVRGEAIQRFAQMTNWEYYESLRRFQRILTVAGINKLLKKQGIREGDIVVIGDRDFAWSDDQTEGALYDAWKSSRAGKQLQGSARWPKSY